MFGRMKQNIREKTGMAKATRLPGDMDNMIVYVETWEKRDKQAVKALHEAIEVWKKNPKLVDLQENLVEMSKRLDKKLGQGSDKLAKRLQGRVEDEKKAYEECVSLFEKRINTFLKAEHRAMLEGIQLLKKKRLSRDCCAVDYEKKQTDERKTKAAVSELEFTTQLAACESLLKKIPDYDQMHKEAFVAAAIALSHAFPTNR